MGLVQKVMITALTVAALQATAATLQIVATLKGNRK